MTQTATCLANLDNIIDALPGAKPGDVVAQWSDGEQIILDGLFVGRGSNPYFGPMRAIRWHCKDHAGMFGRGLALYGRKLPAWAETLPRSK